ncbi:uncharacterized protein LOC142351190 [Convolutriloba macropyga]|uniref:uncharacterized protein LOC142351190 n=1 Tax=Convolutriloba macropyga TaxID=536237 RepID=UPI003F524627
MGYSDLITNSLDDNKDEYSQNGITKTEDYKYIRASEHDHNDIVSRLRYLEQYIIGFPEASGYLYRRGMEDRKANGHERSRANLPPDDIFHIWRVMDSKALSLLDLLRCTTRREWKRNGI